MVTTILVGGGIYRETTSGGENTVHRREEELVISRLNSIEDINTLVLAVRPSLLRRINSLYGLGRSVTKSL